MALPERGAVGRLPTSLPGGEAEPPHGDPLEVDDVGAVEDRHLHRQPGGHRERMQVRVRQVGEPAAARCQPADLEQAHADPVAGDVPFDPADGDELVDHPVHGGLGQPGALGQLVQGERAVRAVEGPDDAVDPAEHRATWLLRIGHRFEQRRGGLGWAVVGLRVELWSAHAVPPPAANELGRYHGVPGRSPARPTGHDPGDETATADSPVAARRSFSARNSTAMSMIWSSWPPTRRRSPQRRRISAPETP